MKLILPFVSAVQCTALQSTFLNERESLMDRMYGDLVSSKSVHPLELLPPADFDASGLQRVKIDYPDNDDVSDLKDDSDIFGGIVTFGHFPYKDCLGKDPLDIAIVGPPFDTGVSFRPGARFSPNGIRQAGRRLGQGLPAVRGRKGSKLRETNPYNSSLTIVDCGDVPMTPFDNRVALNQLYRAQRRIHGQEVVKSQFRSPRVITRKKI